MSHAENPNYQIDVALKQPTRTLRLLEVAGVVTEVVAPSRVVIVGGLAVAYWTGQQSATDIDVAMPDTRELRTRLDRIGFERAAGGRHWEIHGADVALEAPTNRVQDYEVVMEATTPMGRPVHILSPADVLVWRLDEFVGTGNQDVAMHMVALTRSPLYETDQALVHAQRKRIAPALERLEPIVERWSRTGPIETDELHALAGSMRRECYGRSP